MSERIRARLLAGTIGTLVALAVLALPHAGSLFPAWLVGPATHERTVGSAALGPEQPPQPPPTHHPTPPPRPPAHHPTPPSPTSAPPTTGGGTGTSPNSPGSSVPPGGV